MVILWAAGCSGPTSPPAETPTVHVEPPTTVLASREEEPSAPPAAPAEPEEAEPVAVAEAVSLEATALPAPPPSSTPMGAATLAGSEIRAPGPVTFMTAKAQIKPESDPVLLAVDQIFKARRDITLLRIEVHTDSTGADQANQAMSEQRALAVARWFVARGTDCKRLIPVGFGESKPLGDNTTPAGRAQNRRTTFHVAALRGRPIGGAPVDGGGRVAGDPCRP